MIGAGKDPEKSANPLRDRVRSLRRDIRGSSAVEFGLIAMPFLAILLAVFEIGYVDFESEMLEGSVASASRAMLTGQTQGANVSTASAFVNTYLCPTTGRRLPSNFDCTKLIVDVRTAKSFVAGDMTNGFYKSPTNQFCPGAPGQVVVMRVAYPLGAIFPLSLFNRNAGLHNDVPGMSGWYHILMGSALFQEEQYTTAFTAPAGC